MPKLSQNEGGVARGRLYSNGEPVQLAWAKGRITSIEPAVGSVDPDLWLAPGLIDLQINGFAGIDFQQDGLTEEQLLQGVSGLQAAGCTRFLLTLITDAWPRILDRLRHLKRLRAQSQRLRQAIGGWHVEGPFLSGEPGFCGAHDPALMEDPSSRHIEELFEVTTGDPVLLTLAPERPGALDAIARSTARGFKVSLGHTNASTEILRRAVVAGATGFTHLGNACPQLLDRHDNILWRVFDMPGLTVSLIPDAIHVSPELFRLVHRVIRHESIYYTTDAMAAAGAPPGRYRIGRVEVEVGPDRVVRQPGRSNYAGSALRPVDGIFRAASMLGRPWQEVWAHLSLHPARLMGWPHGLAPGQPADFCLLKVDAGGKLLELR
jgi:N-acetylglucosamine-6-phosphate deacetylase